MVWIGAAGCSNPSTCFKAEVRCLCWCLLQPDPEPCLCCCTPALSTEMEGCNGSVHRDTTETPVKGKYKCRDSNKIWVLKQLLFLPKDVVKRFHHHFTRRKNKRDVQKILLLSATQLAFKFAALCGFWDEQISLLGISNTPTDLDLYPANAYAHALVCSIQDTLYVHYI